MYFLFQPLLGEMAIPEKNVLPILGKPILTEVLVKIILIKKNKEVG